MERDSLWERAICLEKRVTALEKAHLRESARRSSFETYKSDFRRSLKNHGPFGSVVDGIGRGNSGYTGTFIKYWSQPYGIARFEEFDREKAAIRLKMMAITEAANRFVKIARKEENNRLAEIARKEEADRLAEIARKEKVAEEEDAGSPDIGGQEDSMAPSQTVRLVQEARQKKEKTIEVNLLALKTEIHARTRSIAQRRRCHQALDE